MIVLSPIIKIRAKISYKESRIITRFFLFSVFQRKHYLMAIRVFVLLFFKVAWRDYYPDYSLFKLNNETHKDNWEIGKWQSICPETLQGTEAKKDTENMKLFSIGREAISHILKTNSFTKKTVLLPNFTCFTVLDPFEQDGWEMHFYRYNKRKQIDRFRS